jgi:hypothetical protein
MSLMLPAASLLVAWLVAWLVASLVAPGGYLESRLPLAQNHLYTS